MDAMTAPPRPAQKEKTVSQMSILPESERTTKTSPSIWLT
jgi:hypothetical protein